MASTSPVREIQTVTAELVEQPAERVQQEAQIDNFTVFTPNFLAPGSLEERVHRLSFGITYMGHRAPIVLDKMKELAASAKAHLESTYADIEIRINNLEDDEREPLTKPEKKALKELKEQKSAFENIKTYQFKKKYGQPALELTYLNHAGKLKSISIFLNPDLNIESLTAEQYISDLEREKGHLEFLKRNGILSDHRKLNSLIKYEPIWKNPDNYHFTYGGNQTTLLIIDPTSKETIWEETLSRRPFASLAPIVSGNKVNLNDFYVAAHEAFNEVIEKNTENFAAQYGLLPRAKKKSNEEIRLEQARFAEIANRA